MPTTFGCPILATSLFLWLGWGSTKTVFICRIYSQAETARIIAHPSGVTAHCRGPASPLLPNALHVAAGAERRQRIGRSSVRFAPGCGKRAHILPEGSPEQFLGSHQVAGLLKQGQPLAIHERSLQIEFLGSH